VSSAPVATDIHDALERTLQVGGIAAFE